MKKFTAVIAVTAALALSACTMSANERTVLGGLGGAAAGLITADLLRANANWTILAVLGGAAAGALVARNTATNECAYARGDGTYRVARCR
ncbi:MAG: glucose-6-phosphate isomerase [Pararhodobacter sp.]|nr:glucose-6-phosphate isomerase [Pararhodobacter sp.]